MFAAERRQRILEMIRSAESVKVDELSQLLRVSASTIRRDLNELHKAALLERTYGGAITSPFEEYPAAFNEPGANLAEEKRRIGQAASMLIKPGQTIFIDSGTTTVYIINYLPDIPNLTIVTFGLNIVMALAKYKQITTICVGGMFHNSSQTFGGVLGVDALQMYNMRFDKSFFAASGISSECGVTNAGFDEIPMKRKTIELSREVILLADSSKIGKNAAGFVAPISKIHRLITGRAAAPQEIDRLRQLGVVIDLV